MAREILPLIENRDVAITPFGVDVAAFSPPEFDERPTGLIGTIKKLDPIYGIDTLRTPSSYDGVLTITVDDVLSLQRYAQHPEHLKIVDYAGRVAENRVVVDYEC